HSHHDKWIITEFWGDRNQPRRTPTGCPPRPLLTVSLALLAMCRCESSLGCRARSGASSSELRGDGDDRYRDRDAEDPGRAPRLPWHRLVPANEQPCPCEEPKGVREPERQGTRQCNAP